MGGPLKLAKPKPEQIVEPTRDEWLSMTRSQASIFNMKTTGSEALDRELRLPHAPLKDRPMASTIGATEVEECQLCDCKITDLVLDAVVAGAGWCYMCPSCHKKHGIGLGEGRGTLYRRDDVDFVKVNVKPSQIREFERINKRRMTVADALQFDG